MAEVYWIHLPQHTDMFSEGYIGYTSKTAAERFKFHLYKMRAQKDNLPLYNAMRKYGESSIVLDVVCICDDAYGLWLENKLRPEPNTGWNSAAGGDTPHNKGRKYKRGAHSAETRAKLSASGRAWWKAQGKEYLFIGPPAPKRPPREHLLEYTKNLPAEVWLRPTSNPEIWLSASIIYSSYVISGFVPGRLPSGKKFNTKTISRWFSSGWISAEDSRWVEWYNKRSENEP